MSGSAAYLDTSAFVKLLVAEEESAALGRRLAEWPHRVAATLLRTEAVRALRRSGAAHLVPRARRMFTGLTFIRLDEPLFDRAGDLEPLPLRSLDAVHLAAALTVGSDLGVFITYDGRLKAAAAAYGIDVESPGA